MLLGRLLALGRDGSQAQDGTLNQDVTLGRDGSSGRGETPGRDTPPDRKAGAEAEFNPMLGDLLAATGRSLNTLAGWADLPAGITRKFDRSAEAILKAVAAVLDGLGTDSVR